MPAVIYNHHCCPRSHHCVQERQMGMTTKGFRVTKTNCEQWPSLLGELTAGLHVMSSRKCRPTSFSPGSRKMVHAGGPSELCPLNPHLSVLPLQEVSLKVWNTCASHRCTSDILRKGHKHRDEGSEPGSSFCFALRHKGRRVSGNAMPLWVPPSTQQCPGT